MARPWRASPRRRLAAFGRVGCVLREGPRPATAATPDRFRGEGSARPRTATAYSTEVPLVARIAPTAAADTLILNAAHPFAITLTARDTGRTGNTGTGLAIPENDIFGFFSIPTITGNSSNPEVFVKIIDGRALNGNYWVFSNGLSDLEYTLTVREVATGRTKTYSKAFGSANACGTFDTSAFRVSADRRRARRQGAARPRGDQPDDGPRDVCCGPRSTSPTRRTRTA